LKRYCNILLILSLLSVTLLIGCQGETIGAGSPFIGGTMGLNIIFLEGSPPPSVFDGGDFPFDIVLKLENVGEYFIERDAVDITVTGFRPGEFGATIGDMSKKSPEDLIAKRKDPTGAVIPGNPVFVEFIGFNHKEPIIGATQAFPIKVGVCYKYGTIANTQLCSRKNILGATNTGVCKINEDKTVFNSGSPVQISTLTQSARAKDKIGFTFKIVHSGTGTIFKAKGGERCDETIRQDVNRIYVNVDTGLPGLSCPGLGEGRDATEGYVTLYNGEKLITCTQSLEGLDFEFPILIELGFDYEEFIETGITVQKSG